MQAIHGFFAAWGTADAAARATEIAATVSAQVEYRDPMTQSPLTSPDAITEYVGGFTQAAPGATVRVVRLDSNGTVHRAAVEFRMADGNAQMGQYFIETDDRDLPKRMIGFAGMGTPE